VKLLQQLDKWNKELELLSQKDYKSLDNKLHKFYKQSLIDIKKEAKDYIDNFETLSFSKKLEVENQFKVANHIDGILSKLESETQSSVKDFVKSEVEHGYYGTFYALEDAENIQLDFGLLNQDYVEQLINKKVAGKTLSKRLYQHRTQLANRVTSELLNGAVRGKGYAEVAKSVGELTEATYKQALRIARTEGGRAQSTSKQRAYEDAKEQGVDIQKRWTATLDKKTRSQHQSLDGQTVDIEEKFEFKGSQADGPRLFGVAALDINCRCTTVTIVNGIEPSLRRDNEKKKVIEYKNYDEWLNGKKKAISKKEVNKDNPFEKDIKAIYKNADNDRVKFASDYLKYSDIDLPVEIENAKARGFNQIDNLGKGEPCSVKRFVLQKNDNRGIDYQIKTALHEGYHARINGLSTNIFYQQSDFDNWLSIEETMTELSAHYQFSLFNDRVLMPAYPNYIALNLPRLKKLPEFKGATSFTDFGKKAMEYRLNPDKITADWTDIYERMEAVDLDLMEYMKDNYVEDMIAEKETILDMIIENNPKFGQFRDNIATDIDDWVIKLKTDDEHHANPSAFTQMVAALYRLKGVR